MTAGALASQPGVPASVSARPPRPRTPPAAPTWCCWPSLPPRRTAAGCRPGRPPHRGRGRPTTRPAGRPRVTQPTSARRQDQVAGSVGARAFYHYTISLNGFAGALTTAQARVLSRPATGARGGAGPGTPRPRGRLAGRRRARPAARPKPPYPVRASHRGRCGDRRGRHRDRLRQPVVRTAGPSRPGHLHRGLPGRLRQRRVGGVRLQRQGRRPGALVRPGPGWRARRSGATSTSRRRLRRPRHADRVDGRR